MSSGFSFVRRQENIQRLKNETFDLLIVGGGINGAGVARDASLRGMKVALIEKNDFSSGTSCRSSKLIHGGIRYLENLEFHLVFEALSEREKLFQMAPHLVHPLRFLLPVYQHSRVGMFKMSLGMWLYDALSMFRAPQLHERLDSKETMQRMPSLQPKELVGSYVYSDAYMDDDRLAIETLRCADRHQSALVSYVQVGTSDFTNEIKTVQCHDLLGNEKFQVRARHVISCSGPWTDEVGSGWFSDWKKMMRPTKGVHITFQNKDFPLSSAMVMEEGGRIVFAIPRHDMVIVGTTDTDFKESPDQVQVQAKDVEYLLQVLKDYFPGIALGKENIQGAYAGVRPLVHDGSSSEGKTSREHTIFSRQEGVTFVAGGKYTTYRLMSQQIVDQALSFFSMEEKVQWKSVDTSCLISPWASAEKMEMTQAVVRKMSFSKMSLQQALQLVFRHGEEALHLFQKWGHNRTYWAYEALHALDSTMCLNIVDFFIRRTPLFLANQDHGQQILPEILPLFQEFLGWSDQQTQQQIQKYHEFCEKELAWQKSMRV
jgi:glycerol-3-phosphate dehydrogenase